MLPDLPRPAIFAHRGASAAAPENTLAAFARALETGCNGIELDAHLSADGHVVVCHDAAIDRTTDGRGRIDHMTLTQLRSYDAGSWFNPAYKDQRIPTLDEVFELAGEKTVINVELKPGLRNAAELAGRVAQIVQRFQLQKSVIISSFSFKALTAYLKQVPQAFLSLLTFGGAFGWLARRFDFPQLPFYALHPHYRDVTPAMLAGTPRVIAYTVDRPADMRRLFEWGIQGIITNEPALAVKLRAEMAV